MGALVTTGFIATTPTRGFGKRLNPGAEAVMVAEKGLLSLTDERRAAWLEVIPLNASQTVDRDRALVLNEDTIGNYTTAVTRLSRDVYILRSTGRVLNRNDGREHTHTSAMTLHSGKATASTFVFERMNETAGGMSSYRAAPLSTDCVERSDVVAPRLGALSSPKNGVLPNGCSSARDLVYMRSLELWNRPVRD